MRHLLACVFLLPALGAAELTVGPGQRFATPSAAAQAAHDGDTVSIAPGTYRGDVCIWTQSNLTLRAVGGTAELIADGRIAGGKAIWVLAGNNTTVEHVVFAGAACADRNGAGIRLEGSGLVVRACRFHDNQDGILTAPGAESDVVIEGCEFTHNGAGDGYSHNLYIGRIRSLLFRGNISRIAVVGHNLKSRAEKNLIIANRLLDEADGTASYTLDLPNGGLSIISGNQLQKGAQSSNHGAMINFAEEDASNTRQQLYVINNTLVNDQAVPTVFINAAPTSVVVADNNLLLGAGQLCNLPLPAARANLQAGGTAVVDRVTYDYRLVPDAAVRDAGVDPGQVDGVALLPQWQFDPLHGVLARTTSGAVPDVGAWELSAKP